VAWRLHSLGKRRDVIFVHGGTGYWSVFKRSGDRFASRKRVNQESRAFSSEVETGSRQENASIKNLEPRFDSIETEKALAATGISHETPGGWKPTAGRTEFRSVRDA
jgi:hypothetical protein